ncbi:MAG: carbohydrate porin [Candidatus Omnitrophota bacterium]
MDNILKVETSPFFIYGSLALMFLLGFPSYTNAAPTPLEISAQEEIRSQGIIKRNWFNNFSDYRGNLTEKYGTKFAFLLNYTQQAILDGPNDKGRSQGVWYWNIEAAQRLWQGAELFTELEVDRGKGVDKLLPTFSGFNDNSGDDANLYIPVLYLEQTLAGQKVFLAAGKLDLSYWFDCNDVANSADTQFLSSALVNNLALPFPAKGIGAMASFTPNDWVYFQAGASSAKASSTKTGLSNAFSSSFFINELGLSSEFGALKGNYRFILSINHKKSSRINSDKTQENSLSWGLSFDQAITGRATLFLRYGFADPKVSDIAYFWSCGGQITEPVAGRKFDCLGAGVAQSIMGHDYRQVNDAARAETIYEAYYSYSLKPALTLTPSIQIVTNPDADQTVDIEVVCGLRLLISF